MHRPQSDPLNGKALFRGLPIFSGVDDACIDQLWATGHPQIIGKGKLLFVRDDPGDTFYLVLSGWVKLFRETLDGEEAVIDILSTSHLFGESTIFDGGNHTFSAMAVEPTQVLAFPTSALARAVEDNSQLALGMLKALSRFRRQQTHEVESLTLQNAAQRIGCFLLRLAPVNGPDTDVTLHLPYDKSLIASRLGMKSETFSRALARLKSEANLQVNGPSVSIDSLIGLSNYCCSACSNEYPCEDLRQ